LSTGVKVSEKADKGNSYLIQLTASRTGDMEGEGYLVTTRIKKKRRQTARSLDSPERDAENVGKSTIGMD
jgi:hypothetical protein